MEKQKHGKIEVKCATCGKPKIVTKCYFDKNKSGNFYCSRKCCYMRLKTEHNPAKIEAFFSQTRNRVSVSCQECGKSFFVSRVRFDITKGKIFYCSKECRYKKFNDGRVIRRIKAKVSIHCSNCDKLFEIDYCYNKNFPNREHFCCRKCQNEWRLIHVTPLLKRRIELKCGLCGKTVSRPKSYLRLADRTFCSKKCHKEWLSSEQSHFWKGGLSFENYPREFNKELKQRIRTRDSFTCQLCGEIEDGRSFDCHHIDYDKKNNQRSNIVLLCQVNGCHGQTLFNRDYWKQYFQNLLSSKYGYQYDETKQEVI